MRDCVTHHHACDCREAALASRIAELEAAIRKHRAVMQGPPSSRKLDADNELYALVGPAR